MAVKIKKEYFVDKLKSMDKVVLAATLVLLSLGILMIFSVTGISMYNNITGNPLFFVTRTVVSAIVGIAGMLALLFIPYQTVKKLFGPIAIGVTLVLLLMALFMGTGGNASDVSRWVVIAGFRFQPAEFVRIGLVISVAWIIQRLIDEKVYFSDKVIGKHFYALGFIILCGGLIILQPDLGSALIVLGIGMTMYLSSGINKKQIGLILLVGIVGLILLGVFMLQGYQRQRFEIWLDPFSHDRGHQNVMGFTSIALGGMFGVGLGNSMQKYGFAIEAWTDFIITILAEELGTIMVLVVMALYFLIAVRCFLTAFKGRDMFSSLVCIGVGAFFLIQPLVNLGGVIGLIPLSGVTLPLISFGGTSLMATFFTIGFYLNARSEIMKKKKVKVRKEENAEEAFVSEKIIPFKQAQ